MVALLRRLRIQGGSDFCHFVREVQSACRLVCPGCESNRPALPAAGAVFLPWGIPFPESWSGNQSAPRSRRRGQRWHRERSLREAANIMIAALNWLNNGCSLSGELVAMTAAPCSSPQLTMMQPLLAELRAWCRSDSEVLLPSDGGLPHVLSALRRRVGDRDLQSQYTGVSVSHDELFAGTTVTQELTPTSMALPLISAQTPLKVPTVPEEVQAVLEQEGAFMLPDQPAVLARTFTSVSSWPQVAAELLRRKLAMLLPPPKSVHITMVVALLQDCLACRKRAQRRVVSLSTEGLRTARSGVCARSS
eukprot:1568903-Amphidinium_carterae.3